MVEGFNYEDIPDLEIGKEQLRKLKEAQAKSTDPLTPVELFVGQATKTNYELFKRAVEEAIEQILKCFNEDWVPEGDPHEVMQWMDHAKNFLILADTYFTALARPLMQAASIHIAHSAMHEAAAPREPSAEERAIEGDKMVGMTVIMTEGCPAVGLTGRILQFDHSDGEYEIHLGGDSRPMWHARSCFKLED